MTTENESLRYLQALPRWLAWAEQHWVDVDQEKGHWAPASEKVLGHCAHGSYLAACVLLAAAPKALQEECHLSADEMIERALKSHRYIFSSHVSRSGPGKARWGHHWGSPILTERLANFVDMLDPFMSDADRLLWSDVLVSEAGHHLQTPIETNRFAAKGETHAERNYWRGSALYRAAQAVGDHPDAQAWMDKARAYWMNSFSVPADAICDAPIDGKPCREWFIGANVHPEFVFEHHGTVSVDYVVHTAAFFTMILVSALSRGWPRNEAMFHHMTDLWSFLRKVILPNGRLAFVGGVNRPRYALSQNYLLPALLAWDRFGGDPAARELARGVQEIQSKDLSASGDGSFYGARMAALRNDPKRAQTYWRLEADVVISLGLSRLITQLPCGNFIQGPTSGRLAVRPEDLNRPLCSRDAAFILQRTRQGLFGVYWGRSATAEEDPPLALCVPFKNPDRVEWRGNLATSFRPSGPQRKLLNWSFVSFDQGFSTAAHILEAIPERGDDVSPAVDQRVGFVLFPDGRTLLRVEKARALRRVELSEVAACSLNLPNDLFTGGSLNLYEASGKRAIHSGKDDANVQRIESPWVAVGDDLGVIALRGPRAFSLEPAADREHGFKTLLAEHLYYPLVREIQTFQAGQTILDTAVLFVVNADHRETEEMARRLNAQRVPCGTPDVEMWRLDPGAERPMLIVLNLTDGECQVDGPEDLANLTPLTPDTKINGDKLRQRGC